MLLPPHITNTITTTNTITCITVSIIASSHHSRHQHHRQRHRHQHYDRFCHHVITIINAIFTTIAVRHSLIVRLGFPPSSVSKESACNAGDPGLIPGSGRSPGEGNGNPLQCGCLENPTDRGAWRATQSMGS